MAINSQHANSQLPMSEITEPAPAGRREGGWRVGSWLVIVLGVGSLLVTGVGCAKARAETVPDGPPLAMPPPPSRVFAPIEDEPLVSSPVSPEAPVTSAPLVTITGPPVRRPAPAQAEPEKAEPAPPPAPVAEAPRELRAASSPGDAEAERKIGDVLVRAARDLDRVDYQRLTLGGKEQYNQAKGFIEEAEKARKERNFVYAETAADKAAKLATELLGR